MSSTTLKTYSADEVTLSIAGLLIDSGFADGEFVSIEMQSDAFADKVGSDGEVARSKTNDRRATVKVKLLQTSQGNDLLSQLYNTAIVGTNGADVGSFQLNDRSGATVARGAKAWIQKVPQISRAREITENEWTLRVSHMDLVIGGNPSV